MPNLPSWNRLFSASAAFRDTWRSLSVFPPTYIRVWTLRVLLCTCILAPCFVGGAFLDLADMIKVVSMSLVFGAHHLLAVDVLPVLLGRFYPRYLDLILVLAECVLYWLLLGPWGWTYVCYLTISYILVTALLHIQGVVLLVIAAIRLSMFATSSQHISQPFNFFDGDETIRRERILSDVILGKSIRGWLRNEEPWPLRLLRSVIGLAVFAGVAAFATKVLYLEPSLEACQIPTVQYRTPYLRFEGLQITAPWWHIVLYMTKVQDRDLDHERRDALAHAVNVTSMWSDALTLRHPSEDFPTCFAGPVTSKSSGSGRGFALVPDVHYLEFQCQGAVDYSTIAPTDVLENIVTSRAWPDLLITVDFSLLPSNTSVLGTIREQVVSIVVGLGSDTDNTIANGLAIPLLPNMHILASVGVTIRQTSTSSLRAALGFPNNDQSLLPRIDTVTPDPSFDLSGSDNNTATLRLFIHDDLTDFQLIADTRTNTILQGFSSTGGLFNIVDGVFSMIFGASLMMIMTGSKPLSIFGLVHKLGWVRRTIHQKPEQYQVVDYLRDYFVDFGPFKRTESLTVPKSTRASNSSANSATDSELQRLNPTDIRLDNAEMDTATIT